MKRLVALLAIMSALAGCASVPMMPMPVEIKFSRQEIEAKWEARIRSFLAKGVIPLIDLQSTLNRKLGERYLEEALPAMDEAGVALIAFNGLPEERKSSGQKGSGWGYYIHEVVNAHPDRFILTTNVWAKKPRAREIFMNQLEKHVRSGNYPIMGEIEFRHYMSGSQCRDGRTDRDVNIPLDGIFGKRLFKLSGETGVAFVIHLEAEDVPLDDLEKMLKAYPKAKVIVAHFGKIRHPEKQKRFGPKLVRHLLTTYPNLHYDLATGPPGGRYACNDDVLTTVIWKDSFFGGQRRTLKPAYREILTKFSTRFVTGLDYGYGRRGTLAEYIMKVAKNVRLIIRDLPDAAKHDIGYRNAWKLLTGKDWIAANQLAQPSVTSPSNLEGNQLPGQGMNKPTVRQGDQVTRRQQSNAGGNQPLSEAEIRKIIIGNTLKFVVPGFGKITIIYFGEDGRVLQKYGGGSKVFTKKWFIKESMLCRTFGMHNKKTCTKVSTTDTPDQLTLFNNEFNFRYQATLLPGNQLPRQGMNEPAGRY